MFSSIAIQIILFNINYLHTAKGFQVVLTIQFKISHFLYIVKWLNSSVWPIDGTLTGTITPSQSGPGSNGNEELLRIP